jgi:hypothetical protein
MVLCANKVASRSRWPVSQWRRKQVDESQYRFRQPGADSQPTEEGIFKAERVGFADFDLSGRRSEVVDDIMKTYLRKTITNDASEVTKWE